mmetsp:Transcript_9669/g.19600  ORF Transcript_9669/g.19600 Transcript_9669/m.19600 type:complete len:216 (+) Transcript_9669:130-777(+)
MCHPEICRSLTPCCVRFLGGPETLSKRLGGPPHTQQEGKNSNGSRTTAGPSCFSTSDHGPRPPIFARSTEKIDVGPRPVHHEHVQLLVLRQAVPELLGREPLPEHRGLARPHLQPGRPRRRRVLPQHPEHPARDVLPRPPRLLRVHEARPGPVRQPDRLVHVLPRHVVGEAEARQRLSQPEDGEELLVRHDRLVVGAGKIRDGLDAALAKAAAAA